MRIVAVDIGGTAIKSGLWNGEAIEQLKETDTFASEGGAALMIITPLLLPVARQLGINDYHFGLVAIVNIMIGGITPPFGSMMFTTCGITGCPISEFLKEVWPFIVSLLVVLLLLTFCPFLITCVPDLLYGAA